MNAEHSALTATWNEAERLIALARYAALDASCDAELDELAAMAADLCACPAAAIHFIDDQYQYCKGAFALQREPVPLARSLCARAILQSEPLITRQSGELSAPVEMPRLAAGEPAHFYAAAILRDDDGLPLGTTP